MECDGGTSNRAPPAASRAVPLPMAPPETDLVVVSLSGGHGLVEKLSSMCLGPGSVVRVVRVVPKGPVLVEVEGTRYAIGRGAAMKVMVAPLQD